MKDPTSEAASKPLTTADAQGRRLWVYPADVEGRFRVRRNFTNGVLLLVFLILPWIKIGGQPVLLLDFVGGRFSVFGLNFWSHDAPKFFFIFAGAAIALAFVTAVWGRVWCGWACPQTVFVDGVFRKIERFIEGDAVRRRRLDAGPMSEEKIFKKTVKWLVFVALSLVLSHSFLAYFIGADALASMMTHSPRENLGSFAAMAAISGLVLFDFGWFREQFCVLVCPYGRFQSVLMDEKSLAVMYDQKRGEPRRVARHLPAESAAQAGDCISCNRCVNVCPTGIDIRNGLQLECIACTACIDACDAVMTKIGKPKGLIRYSAKRSAKEILTSRPGAYLAALVALVLAFGLTVAKRDAVEIVLVRAIGEPYQQLDSDIVNHFRLELQNQKFETVRVSVRSDAADEAVKLISAAGTVDLPAGQAKVIDFFLRFPAGKLRFGHAKTMIEAEQLSAGSSIPIVKKIEVPLVGPTR